MTAHDATRDGNEYRVEFDETGGYDCMTGGFAIVRQNGDIAAEVDLRHYGQKPCDYDGSSFVDAKERAEAVAHRVCAAINASVPSETPQSEGLWGEAFDTFRKYWNSCETDNIPPEFGRIFAIFSDALRGSRSVSPINNDLTRLIDKMHDCVLDASSGPAGNLMDVWFELKGKLETTEALRLAEQWKARADDAGRLSRAVINSVPSAIERKPGDRTCQVPYACWWPNCECPRKTPSLPLAEESDLRAKLALAAEENTANDDILNRLKPWLDNREEDIAHGIEDFGELQSIFRDLFGVEAQK